MRPASERGGKPAEPDADPTAQAGAPGVGERDRFPQVAGRRLELRGEEPQQVVRRGADGARSFEGGIAEG
jgi:hypothetical protein